MRGDDWNTLVSAPSGTEIEAALAEVRLRAVPIARRNARNRRARVGLAGILMVGGAFLGGRMAAGDGVHVGVMPEPSWRPRPALLGAGGHFQEAQSGSAQEVWRFRVTSWQELEGVRFDESETWLEGRPRTWLGLALDRRDTDHNPGVFATIGAMVRGDGITWAINEKVRAPYGSSPEGRALYEEQRFMSSIRLPYGEALEVHPIADHAGEPVMRIRVEGPHVVAPAGLDWRVGRQRAGGDYLVSEYFQQASDREETLGNFRYAVAKRGALSVRALYVPETIRR